MTSVSESLFAGASFCPSAMTWQAKQLQFAEWIDSTFPADLETFGCKNRCNMQ